MAPITASRGPGDLEREFVQNDGQYQHDPGVEAGLSDFLQFSENSEDVVPAGLSAEHADDQLENVLNDDTAREKDE